MKKEITFGIDIDEVLRALVPNMLRLYNEEFDDNMQLKDVKDYVVDNAFPKIMERTGESASKWFFQDHGEELFLGSDMVKGARDAVNALRAYGKVIIISYQKSLDNKLDTLNWLDQYGIQYDGVCFVKDKSLIHTDFLIDDNDWNFIGSNARIGILVTAPYNTEVDINELQKQTNCEEFYRVSSLFEFASLYCAARSLEDCMLVDKVRYS